MSQRDPLFNAINTQLYGELFLRNLQKIKVDHTMLELQAFRPKHIMGKGLTPENWFPRKVVYTSQVEILDAPIYILHAPNLPQLAESRPIKKSANVETNRQTMR